MRVVKLRHEKQKKEEDQRFTENLSEKQSEIDILKQMIKSSNVQLRAREKD